MQGLVWIYYHHSYKSTNSVKEASRECMSHNIFMITRIELHYKQDYWSANRGIRLYGARPTPGLHVGLCTQYYAHIKVHGTVYLMINISSFLHTAKTGVTTSMFTVLLGIHYSLNYFIAGWSQSSSHITYVALYASSIVHCLDTLYCLCNKLI